MPPKPPPPPRMPMVTTCDGLQIHVLTKRTIQHNGCKPPGRPQRPSGRPVDGPRLDPAQPVPHGASCLEAAAVQKQWYLNLSSSKHGQAPTWAHFKDEFLPRSVVRSHSHLGRTLFRGSASTTESRRPRRMLTRSNAWSTAPRVPSCPCKIMWTASVNWCLAGRTPIRPRTSLGSESRNSRRSSRKRCFATTSRPPHKSHADVPDRGRLRLPDRPSDGQAPTTSAADPMQLGAMSQSGGYNHVN
eukprot:350404-Chlamydomonas_euryale.AAC.4